MIKYVEPRHLIQTEEFVRPEIDIESFASNNAKNLIIFGERKSGKSTFLYDLQYRSLGTNKPIIFAKFDPAPFTVKFEDEFMIHYLELEMASKIIRFIFDNYRNIYLKHFKSEREKVDKLIEEAYRYINTYLYKNISLVTLYSSGDLTAEYIAKLKRYASIKDISLIIDRFDWTDGSSLIAQEALSSYFNLFDRSIITTDDESVTKNFETRDNLIRKGFDFLEVNPGKDSQFMKNVLLARINNFNASLKQNELRFPVEIFNNDFIEMLTLIANGNISIAINIMNEMYNMLIDGYSIENPATALINMGVCAGTVVEKGKQLTMGKTIKMHLGNL